MENESRYIVRKVVIDVVCLALVSFPILIFYVFVTPFQRGFFCEDETIKYPFKASTVSSLTLYFVGFGLPILVMLFLEYVNFQNSGQRNHTVHSALGFRIHPWVWRSYCAIGIFGFGVACTVLATDFGKYIIGRLRPHFIDACKPDIDCSLAKYKNVYILPSEFQCVDPKLEKKARLSFPSGHSSFAFYTMVYLIIYLQKNFTWGGSKLLRPVIQFFCFSIAFCTALSRVSDNKHHWSDVLAGSFLGISFALIVAFYISDLCEKKRPIFGLQNERELKDRENSSLHNTNTNHGSISPN